MQQSSLNSAGLSVKLETQPAPAAAISKEQWMKPSFESFPLNSALSGRSLLRASDFIPHFGLSA